MSPVPPSPAARQHTSCHLKRGYTGDKDRELITSTWHIPPSSHLARLLSFIAKYYRQFAEFFSRCLQSPLPPHLISHPALRLKRLPIPGFGRKQKIVFTRSVFAANSLKPLQTSHFLVTQKPFPCYRPENAHLLLRRCGTKHTVHAQVKRKRRGDVQTWRGPSPPQALGGGATRCGRRRPLPEAAPFKRRVCRWVVGPGTRRQACIPTKAPR